MSRAATTTGYQVDGTYNEVVGKSGGAETEKIGEEQFGFMPGKSTTDGIFTLRILTEKYSEKQRELHCVFIDLEKAYDRVPREEVWLCLREKGVSETLVRVVQDMYRGSMTTVRSAVGVSEEFEVKVGLHQGSGLSSFQFAIIMDNITAGVRKGSQEVCFLLMILCW